MGENRAAASAGAMITIGSAQELLARAPWRERVQPDDARAGAVFERVRVGSESFFVKQFSVALEARQVATTGWWQEQLDLCLIGIMATFGWEKALGDADELSWWEAQVGDAAARQHIAL